MARKVNEGVAAAIWVAGGFSGAHRFYLGDRRYALAMLMANGALLSAAVLVDPIWGVPAVLWWMTEGMLLPETVVAARLRGRPR